MNEIIVNGLLIHTKRRYVSFKASTYLEVINNTCEDVLLIKYPTGCKSSDIIDSYWTIIDDVILEDADFIKTNNVPITINGLTLQKLLPTEYNFNQYVVDGIQDFIVDYDCQQCTILIPSLSVIDFNSYIKILEKVPYLKIIRYERPDRLRSFHSLMINQQGGEVISNYDIPFSIKDKYEKYLLKDIDVINTFISQLQTQLENYGVQLVRYPIDQNSVTTNRVIYKINEVGKQLSHKSGYEIDTDSVIHRTIIEFECSFSDLVLLFDFRTKYENIDFISNFTEFYTIDKLGRSWLSSVNWNQIDTSYNPDYSQDSQGNSAQSCTFSCELEYYVIYAKLYNRINEVITRLVSKYITTDSSKESQLMSWIELRNKS